MKSIILSILLFSFSTGLVSQPVTDKKAWDRIYPLPTGENINKIHFVNSNTQFIAGDHGTFIRTTNGGTNWFEPILTDTSFTSMEIIDNNIHLVGGIYGGDNKRIYFKSTNYGLSFFNLTQNTILDPSDNGAVITCITFTDMNTGYISDINGKIYRTKDGGLNWSALNTGVNSVIHKLHFPATATGFTGYAIGGEGNKSFVLKTTDGGSNWTQLVIPQITSGHTPGAIDFVNPDVGYITGGGVETPGAFALKTTDGGINWEYINISSLNTWIVNGLGGAVKVFSENMVYAAGEDGCIARTTNGGIIWQRLFPKNNERYPGVRMNSFTETGGKLYCAGSGGFISEIENDSVNVISGRPDVTLTNVFMIDYEFVTIGNSRRISGFGEEINTPVVYWGYNHGGVQNEKTVNSPGLKLYGCAINSFHVLVCGDSGKVFASDRQATGMDLINIGAKTDERLTAAVSIGFNSFLVAGDGRVFRNLDNLQTWSSTMIQPGLVIYKLKKYSWLDGDFLYGISNDGIFIKSIDNGFNWQVIHMMNAEPVNDVFFNYANEGYACGKNGSVMKTSDGGVTWHTVNIGNDSIDLTSAFMGLFSTGILFGESGISFSTTNNGVTWNSYYLLTSQNVNSSYYFNAFRGVVVTDFNGIFRFQALEPHVENNGSGNAETFYLLQNFPNPFNPKTNIEFNLIGSSDVTLKIYNSLGILVETIYDNKKMMHGTYNVNWDGTGYSSGVYFYVLSTEAGIQSRKMILMK